MKIAKGARKNPNPFARIEDAVAAFQAGQMVIIVDDEDLVLGGRHGTLFLDLFGVQGHPRYWPL